MHALVKDLNHLYAIRRELWELDDDPAGFSWLNADDAPANTISFLRIGRGDVATDAPVMAVVINFSGATHHAYRIGLPRGGRWRVVMDTAGYHPWAPSSTGAVLEAEPHPWAGHPAAVNLVVPALSAVWLVPDEG